MPEVHLRWLYFKHRRIVIIYYAKNILYRRDVDYGAAWKSEVPTERSRDVKRTTASHYYQVWAS